MNEIQDVIRRLRLGESERRIAQDMNLSRLTVRKYVTVSKLVEGVYKKENRNEL